MSEPFDPYHKWLGIHKSEQPPNHYRLLGVRLFEDDLNVIEHAADQRMVYLKTLQTGQNGHLAEKLLNKVSQVRNCLLDKALREQYNSTIHEKLKRHEPKIASPLPPGLLKPESSGLDPKVSPEEELIENPLQNRNPEPNTYDDPFIVLGIPTKNQNQVSKWEKQWEIRQNENKERIKKIHEETEAELERKRWQEQLNTYQSLATSNNEIRGIDIEKEYPKNDVEEMIEVQPREDSFPMWLIGTMAFAGIFLLVLLLVGIYRSDSREEEERIRKLDEQVVELVLKAEKEYENNNLEEAKNLAAEALQIADATNHDSARAIISKVEAEEKQIQLEELRKKQEQQRKEREAESERFEREYESLSLEKKKQIFDDYYYALKKAEEEAERIGLKDKLDRETNSTALNRLLDKSDAIDNRYLNEMVYEKYGISPVMVSSIISEGTEKSWPRPVELKY